MLYEYTKCSIQYSFTKRNLNLTRNLKHFPISPKHTQSIGIHSEYCIQQKTQIKENRRSKMEKYYIRKRSNFYLLLTWKSQRSTSIHLLILQHSFNTFSASCRKSWQTIHVSLWLRCNQLPFQLPDHFHIPSILSSTQLCGHSPSPLHVCRLVVMMLLT